MAQFPDGSEIPKDPMQATADAFKERGAEMAADRARSTFIRTAKGYLPKWAWPLIPGAGGSVKDNLAANASKSFWGMVGGCVFSIFFFGVFGLAVLGVGLIVVYALYTSPM